MTPRAKRLLLALLLLLGTLYRLTAAYPLALERFAPASTALQALHILDGWRPIFYSGQAWMGPAGAYLVAAMFKLFGASSLSLGLFSWAVSVLFMLATVRLAHVLFGIDNALVTAALFVVPIDYLMQLAGQPRAHYTIIFVLVPVLFLATLALLRRQRAGRSVAAAAFGLGFLSGFAFWTNMAIGPAIAVSVLLLLFHLRRAFFTGVLLPWFGGWVVGFWPVIWYNLTRRAVLAGQVDAENTRQLGRVLKAFATNAWPRFWGVDLGQVASRPLRALFVAVLVWIGLLYLWALLRGAWRWLRGEETLGYQLVFGYFFLHLAVTMVSSFGSRFEGGTPLLYVGPLYAVAFCIPALVLQSRLPRAGKAAALLPFALLVGNNLVANAAYPRDFFAALRAHGLSQVTRYPNEANPYLRLCRERGLDAGYLGRAFRGDSAKNENFRLNLECFGHVTFADTSSERYVESALKVDGARRIFWVGIDRGGLRMIGAKARTEPVGQFEFSSEFAREAWEAATVTGWPSGVSRGRAGVDALLDKRYDTAWQVGPQEIAGAVLEFAFDRPERLRQIVLFPSDASRSPGSITVEVSADGLSWRTAFEGSEVVPMFWSVWHPYLKQVKPRLEIALAVADPVRHCRLRFAGSRNRAGLDIREVLFLGDGPAISRGEWEREIDDVVRAVREQGKDAVVAGDHWFANFFRSEGFATDFISNEIVSDTGLPNPHLKAPVPLDFSRPQLLVLQRAFVPAAEALLHGRGIPYRETALRHHVLVLAGPAKVDQPLVWNGLELNELAKLAR